MLTALTLSFPQGSAKRRGFVLKKIESLTVSELNSYVLNFPPQSSSSLEKYATLKQPMGGAISHDQSAHVNFYRGFHSFLTCDVCNDDKSARVVRYRVEMNMLDVYDSVLVGFDDEMSKLTNAAGQEDSHNMVLPQCPADIVGGTFTFQLKLTDFNFLPKISLSRSHTYLIATSPYLFLILRIRSQRPRR
ncbi:hypothetical protein Bca4012_077896 [Brassica carinata]